MQHSLKILIVDDVEQNRLLMGKLVKHLGHQAVLAIDGESAIQVFQHDIPDIVFMDVMMPGLDGYETTERIKALAGGRWVPVIFLSALDSRESLIKGLEVGGDDYLTKPVHFATLKAKIDAIQRVLNLQTQLQQKNAELERYYFHAEEEKRLSSHLMQQMTDAAGLRDAALQWRIFPTEHLSGDIISAHRSPTQALYAMLADGTGHGLLAAINVLPIPQIFYAMVDKGFPLPTIIKELNTKAYHWLPAERFVAATLVRVDEREQTVSVWNGGNPMAVYLDVQGEIVHSWRSAHPPLGILPGQGFSVSIEAIAISRPGHIVVVSDGLLEAENAQGEFYGWERMIAVLKNTAMPLRYQALRDDVFRHLDGQSAHDDLSLLFVEVGGELQENGLPSTTEIHTPHAVERGGWRVEFNFGPNELRYVDVVPQVMNLLEGFDGVRPHAASLFLILTELFLNAFDHGLLKLDSNLKVSPEGFAQYMMLREQRAKLLAEGFVGIRCEQSQWQGQRALRIRVKDSGTGFNHTRVMKDLASNRQAHGRGLPLVRNLVAHLEFGDHGSEVIAHYVY